jgi:hypothetical protein
MEEAFCVCRVHGIVHEALRRAAVATDGETYPRTSFATQTAYDFY